MCWRAKTVARNHDDATLSKERFFLIFATVFTVALVLDISIALIRRVRGRFGSVCVPYGFLVDYFCLNKREGFFTR